MSNIVNEKTMTVKEVAEILGYESDTLRKKIKEIMPEIVRHGTETKLTPENVSDLKKALAPRTVALKCQSENASTDIEMMERAASVLVWMKSKVNQLQKENSELNKTVNILTHVNKTYTATEIAKEMNMKSANELNKWLAVERIQYHSNGTWVLYSEYSNLGYTEIKQKTLDTGKVVYDRHFTQIGREFILKLYEKRSGGVA